MKISLSVQFSILIITTLINFLLLHSVYNAKPRKISNKIFALLSFVTSLWFIAMYASVQPGLVDYGLLILRATFFLAAPMSMLLFLLAHVMPENKITFKKSTLYSVYSITVLMMFLSFTDLMFSGVTVINGSIQPIPGLGMLFFSLVSTFFSVSAVYILIRKYFRFVEAKRKQVRLILAGIFIMLSLIISTIMVPVALFENNYFVSFAPFYVLLFLVFTAAAIMKHRLFNIKLIATESFIAILIIVVLFEGMLSDSLVQLVYKILFAIFIGFLGRLLIRSVKREIRQREKLTIMTKNLETANLRLKQLDQQKTEFLSIASHQLRTPLSIIKGYLELIKDGAYGKVTKATVEILDNMDTSNERLVKLVDEFLDVTRIEQGRTKYNFEKHNMSDLISGVVEELRDRATQKGLKLNWKKPSKFPEFKIDEEKIRHVVFNFIDNATKYTERGKIDVSLEKDAKGVSFKVKDTGIGFNKKDQVNFFQKFFRGTNVKTVNVGGTGLGIYVCKKFIENHKGKVWAKSPGLGKGGEFGFWIPFKRKK